VVPKHRRSDRPSLVSVGAPVNRTEYGPDAFGYGPVASVGPMAPQARARAVGNGYPASNGRGGLATEPAWAEGSEEYSWQEWQDWHDWAPPPALHPDHPSAPVPRVGFSADHPSGPMPIPRGLAAPGPAGAGSRPAPAPLGQLRPLPPDLDADGAGPRGSAAQSASGPRRTRGSGRHAAVTPMGTGDYVAAAAAGAAAAQLHPDGARFQREPGLPRRDAAGLQHAPGLPRRDAPGLQHAPGLPRRDAAGLQHAPGLPRRDAAGLQHAPGLPRRDAAGLQHAPGLPRRDATGYQRQAGSGWQETTDYRRETGPFGPGPGPASGRYQNGRPAGGDSLSRTGQFRALTNGSAAQVAPEAHNDAAAIREAAQLEAATITQHATGQAAAIREAAEREAAELRARLGAMLGELDRMAPPVTASVAAPVRPATAPALPGAEPALPRRPSARPAIAPARPAHEPVRPRGTSARPAAKPTGPVTRLGTGPDAPARPQTKSAGQLDTHGRQRRAMRSVVWLTAGLVAFAVLAGATEIAEHGFGFFAFRAGGFGETPGSITDQQFEAHEVNIRGNAIPKAHTAAAPTGKHHKTSS
jgi:hypothetical protein